MRRLQDVVLIFIFVVVTNTGNRPIRKIPVFPPICHHYDFFLKGKSQMMKIEPGIKPIFAVPFVDGDPLFFFDKSLCIFIRDAQQRRDASCTASPFLFLNDKPVLRHFNSKFGKPISGFQNILMYTCTRHIPTICHIEINNVKTRFSVVPPPQRRPLSEFFNLLLGIRGLRKAKKYKDRHIIMHHKLLDFWAINRRRNIGPCRRRLSYRKLNRNIINQKIETSLPT
jgi:hypothetical protein